MKKLIPLILAVILAAACSNDPSAPSGNLPNVENLRIDTAASRGDTVVLVWDALDVEIDGYHIYYATTVPGDWGEPGVTADTTWTHIATSTGYYELKASKGLEYSSGFSNRVNCRAEASIMEQEMRIGTMSNGLVLYDDGSGWGLGCADSAGFGQDIYVDTLDNKLYIYAGNAHPAQYPGGNNTQVCAKGCFGNVAPEPGASDWVDSVQVTDFDWIFIKLENGDYAELYIDSVFTNGVDAFSFEYQTMTGLRLFNVL